MFFSGIETEKLFDVMPVPACLQLPSRCNKFTFGQVRLETDKKPAKNHR